MYVNDIAIHKNNALCFAYFGGNFIIHAESIRFRFMSISAKDKTLYQLLFIQILFMSGYMALKFPLTLYLTKHKFTMNSAFSVAVTMGAIFALLNLLWGGLDKYCNNRKFNMFVGVLLNVFAFGLLAYFNGKYIKIPLALYTVGSSIYLINLALYVNELYTDLNNLYVANRVLQICMNVGAILGITTLSSISIQNYWITFSISAASMLVALLIVTKVKNKIESNTSQYWVLLILPVMVLLTYLMLGAENMTRMLVIVAFCFASLYLWRMQDDGKKSGKYFILLVIICSGSYWFSNSIFYNEFSILLARDTVIHPVWAHLKPLNILIVDPISIIVTGSVFLYFKKIRDIKAYSTLKIGMALLPIAFLLVYIPMRLSSSGLVPPLWLMFSIILFSSAEFLIQPTLTTLAKTLAQPQHRGFCMGFLKMSRAFFLETSFYLIVFSESIHATYKIGSHYTTPLFLSISAITSVMFVFFVAARKIKRIDNEQYVS